MQTQNRWGYALFSCKITTNRNWLSLYVIWICICKSRLVFWFPVAKLQRITLENVLIQPVLWIFKSRLVLQVNVMCNTSQNLWQINNIDRQVICKAFETRNYSYHICSDILQEKTKDTSLLVQIVDSTVLSIKNHKITIMIDLNGPPFKQR